MLDEPAASMSQHKRKPWSSEPFREDIDENAVARQKIIYFGLLVILMFGILSVQLARMQLINGDKYQARAETNRLRLETIAADARPDLRQQRQAAGGEHADFAAAIVAADVPDFDLRRPAELH